LPLLYSRFIGTLELGSAGKVRMARMSPLDEPIPSGTSLIRLNGNATGKWLLAPVAGTVFFHRQAFLDLSGLPYSHGSPDAVKTSLSWSSAIGLFPLLRS